MNPKFTIQNLTPGPIVAVWAPQTMQVYVDTPAIPVTQADGVTIVNCYKVQIDEVMVVAVSPLGAGDTTWQAETMSRSVWRLFPQSLLDPIVTGVGGTINLTAFNGLLAGFNQVVIAQIL